jgi:inner membrane transporter RhtA
MKSAALRPTAEINFAPLLAVGSMISIQLAAALSRPLLIEMGATATTMIRLAAAATVLLALTRPKRQLLPNGALLAALLLGVSLAGMTVCFFEAVKRIPLGLVTTIAFVGPLALATLGSRRPIELACAALAAVGVVLLVTPYPTGWIADTAGLTLAMAAAACWATYIVFTKRVGDAFEGLQGLAISLLVAAIVVVPIGVRQLQGWPPLSSLGAAAALALLAPLLPCCLEMMALRRMGARPFGILMSLEPAIGLAIGFILLGQEPNFPQLLGVACVVSASAVIVAAAGHLHDGCG